MESWWYDAISIHAPHMGRDTDTPSTSSAAGNFNPRAPYGARLFHPSPVLVGADISIHAPHMGRDRGHAGDEQLEKQYFNPRAPYGARHPLYTALRHRILFQSTRPIWGATVRITLAGRDYIEFQSTRPIWGATQVDRAGDVRRKNFNPRAPYGARHGRKEWEIGVSPFQSTRPIWGATSNYIEHLITQALFQSTRPIWGATPDEPTDRDHHPDFNPRAPYGARRLQLKKYFGCSNISIHAPHMGRDDFLKGNVTEADRFQSTRPIWGATCP